MGVAGIEVYKMVWIVGGRLEYPANEAAERFIQVLDSTRKVKTWGVCRSHV